MNPVKKIIPILLEIWFTKPSEEMYAVVGKIEDNQFIQNQLAKLETYKKNVKRLMKKFEQ